MSDALVGRLIYISETPPDPSSGMFVDAPDVFDVAVAAELLGVSQDSVRKELASKRLRKIKIGSSVRISKRALIDYVTAREREGL